jgi:hypothetical protein
MVEGAVAVRCDISSTNCTGLMVEVEVGKYKQGAHLLVRCGYVTRVLTSMMHQWQRACRRRHCFGSGSWYL